MAESEQSENKKNKSVSRSKTLIISLLILLAGAVIVFIIFRTEPTAKRGGATKETAMLVDVVEVERGNYRPEVVTTGSVMPSKDIILSPRVSGEVIAVSPNFTPGGYVKKGEVLLRIDPADYQNNLQLRESDLLQAEADLNIEMGRQNVAQKDYQLLAEEFAGEDKSLVLREPQLNAAKSEVEAARAAVEQGRLDLQRTTIRAPFDAHILNRNVNTGSQVSPGENLGRLVGMDVYWVEAALPLAKLRWLSFPESENEKGSPVKITNRTAWEKGNFREGYLYKLIGSLEGNTRLARALVAVEDPLLQQTDTGNLYPLIIGSFMEVRIEGTEIDSIFRVKRNFIRKDETVWLMIDNELEIREVDIQLQDAEYAYITSGLDDNDKIVTTNLTTVAEGVKLRVENSDSEIADDKVGSLDNQKQTETDSSGGTQ
ncbi:MAG TPA: efflux RND transporter periplasmic adaptor subunit [Tangfeifania sp.]|nr:efflux RND transporter periplasmic adaptor subunit [Tangfeifania sp.]